MRSPAWRFAATMTMAAVALSLVTGCSARPAPAPAGAGTQTAGNVGNPGASAPPPTNRRSSATEVSLAVDGSAGRMAAANAGAGGAMNASPTTPTAGAPAQDSEATSAAGSDGAMAVPATFQTVQLVITQVPCFGAGCHNDPQNPLDLRMDDQLYTRMTSHISRNCGEVPVVNPGDPQRSALVKILKGPCGPTPRMPLGCVDGADSGCVPEAYIAAIEHWIEAGAPSQ